MEIDAPEDEQVEVKPKPPLNDFTVKKTLGKGAFASVYKVTQMSTGETYAMKVMAIKELKNKGALGRVLEREKPVLEQLSHPFIVGLVGGYISKNRVYLVMEYCPGGDLKKLLTLFADRGRFSEQAARFYTAELILAIDCLHSKGVIYRDLKPENVLLDREGHIRLADFGLVKQNVADTLEGGTSFLGTPLYLSPEMVQKTGHGHATDWWGLGVMLYEMLTGDAPFQGADGTIDGLSLTLTLTLTLTLIGRCRWDHRWALSGDQRRRSARRGGGVERRPGYGPWPAHQGCREPIHGGAVQVPRLVRGAQPTTALGGGLAKCL